MTTERHGDEQEPREGGDAPRHPDEELSLLRDALDGLRHEIDARFHAPVLRRDLARDGVVLYERLRRRVQMLGMRSRPATIDEFGLDVTVLDQAQPLLDFLYDRWWRVEVQGLEGVPSDRPSLFVANHAGLLPWDGLMIAHALARHAPEAPRARFLVADWLITLPFVQAWVARLGGARACRENAERLLGTDRSVIAFPEGQKGAAKPFRDRYRVQRFGRGGVVRTALRTRVPLVPVAVVGAEEAHPLLFRIGPAARTFGLPFLPVTPTFPALGPLGAVPLPSKWRIEFGRPIETAELGPDAAGDELRIWRLTEELRTTIQRMVDANVHARDSVWG